MRVNKKKLIFTLSLMALFVLNLFLGYKVIAEEFENEVGEGNEAFEELASGLGVLAVSIGFLLNALYIFQKILRTNGVKIPIKNIVFLRFHIVTNILLALAGIYHGYLYLNQAGPVEYFLVGTIIFIIVTGLILRYAKNRHLKVFGKLLHAQRLISFIILVLVGIHILSVGE